MTDRELTIQSLDGEDETTVRAESGQDILEYALVLPLLLLLLFGIVEFGIVYLQYNTIANAAREGARAGIIPPTESCDTACVDAKVTAAVRQLTVGLESSRLTIDAPVHTATTIQVSVSYDAHLVTGSIIAAVGGSDTIPLQATVTMQTE